MELLAGKGEIRWDDRDMWKALNKFSKGRWPPIYAENDLQPVIDGLWNEGMYNELRQTNDGKYNKNRSDFMELAERLASDPNNTGGLEGACRDLLFKHMRGEYVNPAQYEAYLAYAIKAGKMSMQDKIYFLVMGLGARGAAPKDITGMEFPKDKNGKVIGDTLLSTDRYGKLESEFLVTFPIIDYWQTGIPRLKDDGTYFYDIDKNGKKKPRKGIALKGNWIDMVNKYVSPNLAEQAARLEEEEKDEDMKKEKSDKLFKPGEEFGTWIDRDMVWDESFRVRLAEKASRNVSAWDHDDFHYFGPLIPDGTIDQLARYQGGGEQKASVAGLKNTYAGFNNYIKNTFTYLDDAVKSNDIEAADANSRRMVNLLRSFTRFDSIMSKRFQPNTQYSRLGDRELSTAPGADASRPTSKHKEEVEVFMEKLCNEIGLGSQWAEITEYVSADDNAAISKRSNLIEAFGPRFEGEMNNYIKKHKAEGLNSVIQKIQAESGKDAIKGILSKPAKKISKEELEGGKISLQEYERKDLKDKVQKLRDLQSGKGLKTKSQMAAEDSALLSRVIDLVDNDRYAQVSDDGEELLDKAIRELQGATDSEGGVAPKKAPAPKAAPKGAKPGAGGKRPTGGKRRR
jgi:hypothetical protein